MSVDVTQPAAAVQGGAPTRRGQRLLAIGGVMLALLLVLELGARAIEGRLATPLVWHTYEAQRKVEQMDARATTGVDVVFLGSSMSNTAMIPSLFESTVGGGITAYNAALNSGTPRLSEAWGLRVMLPRLHPKLVVIGVSSADMTDNGAGRTVFFDAMRDSPGGRESLGRESIVDRTDRVLRDHLALWAHRAELRNPTALWDAIRGTKPPGDLGADSLDEQGRMTYFDDWQFDQRPPRARIPGVSEWGLGTQDPGALRRLIAGAQHSGARVVLVDLPVTPEYIAYHPRGDADYQESKRAIGEMARDTGVGLIDLDQTRDHGLFADELHLNHKGATAFTVALTDALRAEGALPSR